MWQDKDGELYRKFEFKNFKEAFDFMQKVAATAEKMDHHPKWTNQYNVVEIWLSTHSEGTITDKDHQLAKEIDKIYENA
jgi:4a-hydroxytetrahydrobiopterin dehydratase